MTFVTFNGLSLLSAPGRVMTPRVATEQVVSAALERIAGQRRPRIADVGTGSGAIAVALAESCPEAEIWATDTSSSAVALARANVRRLGFESRVTVRRGDLLEPVPGRLDLIVANLPYLPAAAVANHPDLRAEPFAAVFSEGDGLEPYRRLLDAAAGRLADGGALLLQLHRRVIAAGSAELPQLRAALGGAPVSAAA